MITCFVDKDYNVCDLELEFQEQYVRYGFHLERRMLVLVSYQMPFITNSSHDKMARDYFDELVGTPEKLMAFSRTGYISKPELAVLLKGEKRLVYLNHCFDLERRMTKRCGDEGDPCLMDGCSFKETEEVCLNAILLFKDEYLKGCAAIWEELFMDPDNRIDVWRN